MLLLYKLTNRQAYNIMFYCRELSISNYSSIPFCITKITSSWKAPHIDRGAI